MATGGPAPGCARDRGRGDADVPPHRASAAPHAEPHTHRGAAQPTERPRGRRADPGWDIGHMWGARGTACGTRAAPGAAQSPAGSGGAHPAQPRTTPCFWPLSAAGGSAAVCPMGAALPAPLQGSTCSAALGNPGGGRRGGAGNSSCVLAQGDGQWSPAQPPAPGGSFVQEIISCSESLTLTAALLAHLPAAGRGDVQGRARCCPTERLCGCVCAPCPPPPRPPTELRSQRPSLWAQHGHGATLWHTQSLRHGAEHRSGRGAMAWRGWLLPGVAAEGPWSHGDWRRRARSAGGAVGAEQRHRAWRPRVGTGWGHRWTAPKPPAGRDGSDGDGGSWDNPEYKIPPCPTPV